MKICYFGGYDLHYTRNYFLRQALAAVDVEVVICRVDAAIPTWRKIPRLVQQFVKECRDADVLLLAEFSQSLAPLAWVLAKLFRQKLVFDFVNSLYEGSVIERQRYAATSKQAQRLFRLDQRAANLADHVLVITPAYKAFFHNCFAIPVNKMTVVPLGVDNTLFRAAPSLDASTATPASNIKIIYVGSFIPNHGMDTIAAAVEQLQTDPVVFTFVGDGEGRADLERRLDCLANVNFVGKVSFQTVPHYLQQADIVLGVFGATRQAEISMANKILQGMAMGKPVVTGRTATNAAFFNVSEELVECELANPEALVSALRTLIVDAQARTLIGNAAKARINRDFLPLSIGRVLNTCFSNII